MKKILFAFLTALAAFSFVACSKDNGDSVIVEVPSNPSTPTNPSSPGDSTDNSGSAGNPGGSGSQDSTSTKSNILVAYFSWGGNTRNVANRIVELTGADLYEIQPETPYTTDYQTLAYTVARNELDTDARPALKETDADFSNYSYVFIGCPVWWGTAPMIMSTFCENYDFKGKTVIPFCTYATSNGTTIQKICDLTPNSNHLNGFGTSGGNTSGVEAWLKNIGITQ